MAEPTLNSLYRDNLRRLNPHLPGVREHLVKKGLLTRAEASRGASSSGQFSLLCQQLASKGVEQKEQIIAEIKAFDQSQGSRQKEQENEEKEDIKFNHRHILNGRRKDEGKERNDHRHVGEVQITDNISLPDSGKRISTEMEPFFVKFCCLICHLLQTYQSSSRNKKSHGSSCDPHQPDWLLIDLSVDQVLSYFPSHLRSSLGCYANPCRHSNGRSRATGEEWEIIRLSELMGLFKSYVRRNEAESKEKKMLVGKTKLLQSLTERNAHLEDQLFSMSHIQQVSDPHKLSKTQPLQNGHTHRSQPESKEKEEIAKLKKQMRKMEARERELVTINEQWAIDAGEKASKITILQIQLQDANSEIQRLNRLEVTGRNHDSSSNQSKLMKQMEEEMKRLREELEEEKRQREEDKDEIEELRDRAANLKIQAQSKMPTVTEVLALTSENRQLREAVEKGKEQVEALLGQLKQLERQHLSTVTNHETKTKTGSSNILTTHTVDMLPEISSIAKNHSPTSSSFSSSSSSLTIPNNTLSNGPIACEPILPQDTPKANVPHPLNPSLPPPLLPLPSSISLPPSHSIFPPPNQPEAIITLKPMPKSTEKKCPKCGTVFLTIGEREFQSHVGWCHLSPL